MVVRKPDLPVQGRIDKGCDLRVGYAVRCEFRSTLGLFAARRTYLTVWST